MISRIKQLLKSAIDTLPYVSTLKRLVSVAGQFPPGHYYSPVPSEQDINRLLNLERNEGNLHEIDFRHEEQEALLKDFSKYYENLSFPETKEEGYRFHYNQNWFCYSDAIMLHCFLKHFQPKKIIEIGSGFSSAVMLDTVDLNIQSDSTKSITFIEPYPERLHSTLKKADYSSVTILESFVQDIDPSIFSSLESGDLLFIDSSHVLKFGSDLQHIMFNILPALPVGIHVHFHDIFYPFEYPENWTQEGKYWNECYILRAFLSSNKDWSMTLFNDYANKKLGPLIEKTMPLCRKNFGGSLYLQKTS